MGQPCPIKTVTFQPVSVCLLQGHTKEILLEVCSLFSRRILVARDQCAQNSFNECLCLWLMSHKPETNVFKHSEAYLSRFWGWKTIAKYGWNRSSTFMTEASKGIRWTGGQTVGTPTAKQVPFIHTGLQEHSYMSNVWGRVH